MEFILQLFSPTLITLFCRRRNNSSHRRLYYELHCNLRTDQVHTCKQICPHLWFLNPIISVFNRETSLSNEPLGAFESLRDSLMMSTLKIKRAKFRFKCCFPQDKHTPPHTTWSPLNADLSSATLKSQGWKGESKQHFLRLWQIST